MIIYESAKNSTLPFNEQNNYLFLYRSASVTYNLSQNKPTFKDVFNQRLLNDFSCSKTFSCNPTNPNRMVALKPSHLKKIHTAMSFLQLAKHERLELNSIPQNLTMAKLLYRELKKAETVKDLRLLYDAKTYQDFKIFKRVLSSLRRHNFENMNVRLAIHPTVGYQSTLYLQRLSYFSKSVSKLMITGYDRFNFHDFVRILTHFRALRTLHVATVDLEGIEEYKDMLPQLECNLQKLHIGVPSTETNIQRINILGGLFANVKKLSLHGNFRVLLQYLETNKLASTESLKLRFTLQFQSENLMEDEKPECFSIQQIIQNHKLKKLYLEIPEGNYTIDFSSLWTEFLDLEKLTLFLGKKSYPVFERAAEPHPSLRVVKFEAIYNDQGSQTFLTNFLRSAFTKGNKIEKLTLQPCDWPRDSRLYPFKFEELKHLDFTHLLSLDLRDCLIQTHELMTIFLNPSISSLKTLSLRKVLIIDAEIADFKELEKEILKESGLQQINGIIKTISESELAKGLMNLKLEEMNLTSNLEIDEEIAGRFKSLKTLDLSFNPIVSQGFAKLFKAEFPNLKEINFSSLILSLTEIYELLYESSYVLRRLRSIQCGYDTVAPKGNLDSELVKRVHQMYNKVLRKAVRFEE